jgi:glutamate-1-semialdehyde 2,1-aminomutase
MKDINKLKKNRGIEIYNLAKKLIPGGTQLLSKRPEMFAPDIWPAYYSRAKGCKIWDLEDNEFVDMSIMSVGACILGYADEDVDEAVVKAIKDGSNSTLNCEEEVILAETLIDMHPWFDMVRYARSGGEAMSIAVRLARAHTKKDIVLFSGYHGWNDWYLAANIANNKNLDGQLMPGLKPNGVPRSLKGSSIPFEASNIESLKEKIKGKEKKIAAIIIEPARGNEASKDYLKKLRELSSEIGAILIFDEITSGFRMCPGGIHRKYKVYPDISVFAKSLANGYAMSAIIGKEFVMQSAQTTFISSTNWTDRVGPAAALATIKKYKETNTDKHIINIGNSVKGLWKKAAKKNKLKIKITGLPSLASFAFETKNKNQLNTVFTIEMLKRGFLGFRQFKPSLSHTGKELKLYEQAVNDIFKLLSLGPEHYETDFLNHHDGFKRLTKE